MVEKYKGANKLSQSTFSPDYSLAFVMFTYCWPNSIFVVNRTFLVKVQFRGPKLYKKQGTLFQEESYLSRIFRSSSLNLHTFHLINIVFDGKFSSVIMASWPLTIGKTTMFWSSTLWSWHHNALSSQPITHCKAWQPRASNAVARFWTRCHVNAMAAIWQNHISKNIRTTFKLRPSIYNRIANFHEGIRITGRYNSSWNSAPLSLKILGPLNCTFTHFLSFVFSFIWMSKSSPIVSACNCCAHRRFITRGLILGLCPAYERRSYNVMLSLIGWPQT